MKKEAKKKQGVDLYPVEVYIMSKIERIVRKKRDGGAWTEEEVKFIVSAVHKEQISSNIVGALFMAAYLRGMTDAECKILTYNLLTSGDQVGWPEAWQKSVVGVLSIWEVGSKTRLVLAPCLAACGLKVPILSAVGQGYSGSVVEKMESIPGFTGAKDLDQMQDILERVGCCVAVQPDYIAPAERMFRDHAQITQTLDHAEMLASCITARAAGQGTAHMILEIRYGEAGFLKTEEQAKELARIFRKLHKAVRMNPIILLHCIDKPVGKMIGNCVEIAEVVQTVLGKGPDDLVEIVCKIGSYALLDSGKVTTLEQGVEKIQDVLKNGAAKLKMMAMLEAQGVKKHFAKDLFKSSAMDNILSNFSKAAYVTHLTTETEGYLHHIDAISCGRVLRALGCGRSVTMAHSKIDKSVGLEIVASVGDKLQKGAVWGRLQHNMRMNDEQIQMIKSAISVTETFQNHHGPSNLVLYQAESPKSTSANASEENENPTSEL